MALPKGKIHTIDDIYALPEGTRAELIDGELYMMAPPNFMHQNISAFLHSTIYSYIKGKKGDCSALAAPFAVFLNGDDRTYVEPDISVICDKKKLDEKGCNGAPDWIIEIVSPGSRRMDYFVKLFKYRTAGVKEYWIVDPDKTQVTVYDFEREDMNTYSFAQEVPAGIYEGNLKIRINHLE